VEADGVLVDRGRHWDDVYGADPTRVSWYQPAPVVSLELIDRLGLGPDTPVVDVGGGASTLVDELLARRFTDVTVLDVSAAALSAARRRLGPAARRVQWLHEDLLRWRPVRRYGLWHDRAVFHFLVDDEDRNRYRRLLAGALRPGGGVIMATFGPSGPDRCSGLPVRRYGPDDLAAAVGGDFDVVATRHEDHTTPGGVIQSFIWVALAPGHTSRNASD
jgi:SAM-dependent methyltransferase